jgi:hypothetical protein
MHAGLAVGARVETVKPANEAKDWTPEAMLKRRWGALGHIIGTHDPHGFIYAVEHDDDHIIAAYEHHELVACQEGIDYTPAERAEMLRKMTACANAFYSLSALAGCHAMIEFTGLMNEFIKVCQDAHANGQQFPLANTHSGVVLPFKKHNATYLGEKLNCIYGPAFLTSEENRAAFVAEMFGGAFKLVPAQSGGHP